MSSPEMLTYYEKMYLSEQDVKERINTRVQITFTLLIALVTVASYMLRMLDFKAFPEMVGAMVLLMLVFVFLIALSSYYSVRAFWGNEFKQMPSAQKVENYYLQLLQYNSAAQDYNGDAGAEYVVEYVDVDAEMESMFSDHYRECADHNAEVNQQRSRQVYLSIGWLLVSLAPFALAGLLFVIFDLDTSSPRKSALIADQAVAEQLGHIDKTLNQLLEQGRGANGR